MIIEKELERRIIDALKGRTNRQVYFSGAWESPEEGETRGDEAGFKAVCSVTVSPRTMPDYGGGTNAVMCDFNVQIEAAQVVEDDARGARILELWEAFAPVVWQWVKVTRVGGLTELAVEPAEDGRSFHPGGVQQTGGTAPAYDAQKGVWTFSVSFTVRGIVRD